MGNLQDSGKKEDVGGWVEYLVEVEDMSRSREFHPLACKRASRYFHPKRPKFDMEIRPSGVEHNLTSGPAPGPFCSKALHSSSSNSVPIVHPRCLAYPWPSEGINPWSSYFIHCGVVLAGNVGTSV
eukprot:scaffold2553_cov162-Skeletonema_marinoi.AAC.14